MDEARRYGVANREELAGLSGLDFLRALIDGRFPSPTIGRTMGFRLVEVAPGLAVFEGEPFDGLLNPLGGVPGGWALALIDSATGCAVHSELPPGIGYASVETKANFVRPIAAGGGT